MKVFSFAKDGNQMLTVEVEINLIPGLPQVQFTGLPDTVIKESIMRIKSAINAQGFEWPKTRQIIINLRPAYLKKSSQGLELAIACALLWKTKQIEPPSQIKPPFYIYGELSLDGKVSMPNDWQALPAKEEGIITGWTNETNYLCPLFQMKTLLDLKNPTLVKHQPLNKLMQQPSIPNIFFSKEAADILSIIATGEHSTLLAGEAGSGKSTLAEHLFYLLPPPSLCDFSVSRQIWSQSGEELKWRPYITPHHSTTPLAMIGGGYPLFFGEITKAHGGLLFMDEYLEFHPRVQEALREPMEKGEIYVARKGKNEVFPAQFLLIAATNLCPCGDLVPGQRTQCSYSLRRCFSHLERLNGPMLDRFDTLVFSTQWKGSFSVPLKSLQEKVFKATLFRQQRKQQKPNGRLSIPELESSLSSFIKETQLSSFISSHRRKRAVLRVARTLADLQQSPDIKATHIEQAKEFSFIPFTQLKNKADFP